MCGNALKRGLKRGVYFFDFLFHLQRLVILYKCLEMEKYTKMAMKIEH